MRKAFLAVCLIVAVFFSYNFISKKYPEHAADSRLTTELTTQRLNQQVNNLKSFLDKNPNYNQEIAFFIDMKVMSGKNRFFVYDFQKNKIIDKGLVAHGSGSELDF